MTLRHDRKVPNVFINQYNYKIFFNNVNYSTFSEEEKRAIFKTLQLSLLIDEEFASFLVNEQNENPSVASARIALAVEHLVDRHQHADLNFVIHLYANRTIDKDDSGAAHLAGYCGGLYNLQPNPTLAQKIGVALDQESKISQFGLIFKSNYEIVKARMELHFKVFDLAANSDDTDLKELKIVFIHVYQHPQGIFLAAI